MRCTGRVDLHPIFGGLLLRLRPALCYRPPPVFGTTPSSRIAFSGRSFHVRSLRALHVLPVHDTTVSLDQLYRPNGGVREHFEALY